MIATIAPLVKVARQQWITSITLFVVASAAAGGLIGLICGWAGQNLFGGVPVTVLVPCAFVLGLLDLGLIGSRVPTISGSVPRDWWERLGPTWAAALYGMVLGMGVTTLVPLATFYFLLTAAALSGPTVGAAIGIAYGSARAVPVVIASVAIIAGADPLQVGDWGHSKRLTARTVAGVFVLAIGLALGWQSLA
jgi:hypothetical protein